MRNQKNTIATAAALITAFAATQAQATVIWDEGVDGELAAGQPNPISPTLLGELTGNGTVIGSVITDIQGSLLNADAFNIVIPEGYELIAICLDAWDHPALRDNNDDNDGAAITTLAINDLTGAGGTSFVAPGEAQAQLFTDTLGTDVLDDLVSDGNNAAVPMPPLGPGSYTFVVDDQTAFPPFFPGDNNPRATYQLTFKVEQIPAPGVMAMSAMAMAFVSRRRRG